MTDPLFVVERLNGRGVAFIRLSGRIDNGFDAAALGPLDVPLALDLSGIRAITSFGVCKLSAALARLGPQTPAYVLECPPCVVDQINVVQGFLGPAEVLTARALFACNCGAEVEQAVDVLTDGARIRAGRTPHLPCHACGAALRLIEDDTFRFVAHKGARRLDPRVGAMLTQLGIYTQAVPEDRPLQVRKVVDGANVALRLDGAFGAQSRLTRVADDDGIVVLLTAGLIVREPGQGPFGRLLAALGRSAKEVVLRDVPPQLASQLASGAIPLGTSRIASLLQPVRCLACDDLALASTALHDGGEAPRCPRCGQPAQLASRALAPGPLRANGPPSAEAWGMIERVDGLFSQAAIEAKLVSRPRADEGPAVDSPAQIGGYKILRPLSAGGMAEVLLATRPSLGGVEKLVALKRFRRELFQAAPAAIAMFLSEARLAAQLSHPNIVQIFDVGEADGDLYMAMELVDGYDLRELIDKGGTFPSPLVGQSPTSLPLGRPAPPHVAAHLGLEIARALAYLHQARDLRGRTLKIVHRDVSPQNVLVDKSGRVVLIDFGVALAGEGELQQRRRKVAGNLAFMSPEQCYGEPLDGRSDLFSLGVVLWELLTGEPLFRRREAVETRRALLAGVIPATPHVPAPLDTLVRRLLSPDREDRPASAEVVATELDAMLPELGGRITPAELGTFIARALDPRRAGPRGEASGRVAVAKASAPTPRDRRRWALYGAAVAATAVVSAILHRLLMR